MVGTFFPYRRVGQFRREFSIPSLKTRTRSECLPLRRIGIAAEPLVADFETEGGAIGVAVDDTRPPDAGPDSDVGDDARASASALLRLAERRERRVILEPDWRADRTAECCSDIFANPRLQMRSFEQSLVIR